MARDHRNVEFLTTGKGQTMPLHFALHIACGPMVPWRLEWMKKPTWSLTSHENIVKLVLHNPHKVT